MKVNTYKTIILPVVLYGCKTWSLTLREEHRLSVFENKVLRKIFGVREMKLQENGESYVMLSYMHCVLRLSWTGHVARMEESRNAYKVLIGKPKGKISSGRPRRRWDDV